MRFMVELFRYIIIIFLAIIVIAIVVAGLFIFDQGLVDGPAGAAWFAGSILALLFMVMSLGLLAILFSIHDRHIELVSETERVADFLAALVDTQQHKHDE